MRSFLFAFLITTATTSLAQTSVTCPLGAGNDHLTLQQVMINFGSYFTDAEDIVVRAATNPYDIVDNAAMQAAADKLPVAIACTDAVLNNPAGDLLPSEAADLTGQAQTDYIADYVYFMGEFHDDLVQFTQLFNQMIPQPVTQRDYKTIYALDQSINQLVDHAHSKLGDTSVANIQARIHVLDMNQPGPTASPARSLKQDMLQAAALIKSIGASVTDATQNQTNADRAGQAAGFFKDSQLNTPDSISEMPADQQAAAMQDYVQSLQQAVDTCLQLQSAFLADDNTKASTLLVSLGQIKTDGHNKYNN